MDMELGVTVEITVTPRPLCEVCKRNLARKFKRADGKIAYRKKCTTCQNPEARRRRENREYTLNKKDHCENPDCKWVGEYHPSMLDVDQIDGDKTNNDPSNHQTLCANCHRVKTFTERDSVNVKYRSEE